MRPAAATSSAAPEPKPGETELLLSFPLWLVLGA